MPLTHHGALAHRPFARRNAPLHYSPDLRVRPHHLELKLTVDIEARRVSGAVTTTVRAHADHVDTLVLDAVDLEIRDVVDPDGREVSYTYDSEKLTIRWAEALSRDEERRVLVSYVAQSPVTALYFSSPDAEYPDAAYFAATDHETQRARHWLPCIDHPDVRCTLDMSFTTREGLTVLANGTMTDEVVHDDGTQTITWRLDYPCPSYLLCFAIGEFTRADDVPFGEVPVAYFGAKHTRAEDLIRAFGRTAEMLEWMTGLLGVDYPFPKYFQFALPYFGGAMENISLVSWDEVFVLDEELAKEWGWLVDQINVHEMGHTFFGDAIVCRDFSQAWLKESWATYIEQCWLEHKHGADEQLYDFYSNRAAYFDEADHSYKRPIVTRKFDSAWQLYDRHLYPGGAARLHMLRRELGDEVFWAAVREYTATYMGRTVETHDFRVIMERHAGRALNQFFDQWIYSAGYPALKATHEWDSARKRATITLEQTQHDPDKDDTEPLFVMDVDVAWIVGDEVVTRTVRMDKKRVVLMAELAEEPTQVRVDPDNKLVIKLEFNPGDAQLRAQLTGAPDVIGRILAAHELAKTAKRANVEAIAAAYPGEGFWGVRVQWARALGSAKTHDALDALLKIAAEEQDPMVMESAIIQLTKWRDARIVETLQARLSDGLPYRARAAAYRALGAQRHNAPLELLREAARTPTFSGFAQAGAIAALAMTRDTSVLGDLMGMLAYGDAHHRARAASASALGELIPFLDERDKARAIEALIDRLDTAEEERTRWAAARALTSAQATQALPALSSLREWMCTQDQVDLDPLIARLRASGGDEPKVKALEKTVEELREALAKLTQRFETLEAQSKPS